MGISTLLILLTSAPNQTTKADTNLISILSLLVAAAAAIATILIAVFSYLSAKASAQSAELLTKAYLSAFLRLQFLIYNEPRLPDKYQPATTEHTSDYHNYRSSYDPVKDSGKHVIYASVKNLGPGVALDVCLTAVVEIIHPSMGTFSKEVRIRELPILEPGHRHNVLTHIFEAPDSNCKIKLVSAKLNYTTLAGKLVSSEPRGAFLKLITSPIASTEDIE